MAKINPTLPEIGAPRGNEEVDVRNALVMILQLLNQEGGLALGDANVPNGAFSPAKIAGTAVVTADTRLTNERTPVNGSVTQAKMAAGVAPRVVKGGIYDSVSNPLPASPSQTGTNGYSFVVTGTGRYTVTFDTPFTVAPKVMTGSRQVTGLTGSIPGVYVVSASTTQVVFQGGTPSSTSIASFDFLCIEDS